MDGHLREPEHGTIMDARSGNALVSDPVDEPNVCTDDNAAATFGNTPAGCCNPRRNRWRE